MGAKTGEVLLTLKGHAALSVRVSFSRDGTRIVTGSGDSTAKVWDAKTGADLLTLKGHTSTIFTSSFSADGLRIVTGSADGTARVWDAKTGAEILVIGGHTNWVFSAFFNSDASRILTASRDRTARVWDAKTGMTLFTLTGHSGEVQSALFSADGSRIITGSSDGTARVWEAATGADLLTLSSRGHSSVLWAEFSLDGGGFLPCVRRWHTESLGTAPAGEPGVSPLAFKVITTLPQRPAFASRADGYFAHAATPEPPHGCGFPRERDTGERRDAGAAASPCRIAARRLTLTATVSGEIPASSEEAWQLLLHYNDIRCRPPWKPHEYRDLRRKLADADVWATQNAVDRGRLAYGNARLYSPLPGPLCPMSVPDYALMAKDTPALVLTGKPCRVLRLKAVWDVQRIDAQVPDVFVRWAYWAAKSPKNWRRRYLQALAEEDGREEATCDEACPLKGSKVRHSHFSLPEGRCGLLAHFKDYEGNLDFDSEQWKDYVKKGDIYYGYWPALVFGTAPKVGLSVRQTKLLMAITRELTRLGRKPTQKFNAKGQMIYYKPESDRADRAEVIRGSRVQNSAYNTDKLVCPLLDKGQQYVAFCGNYRWHRGRGYTFAAWLERAGYASDFDDAARFMADLALLAEKFDFVAVGRHHDSRRWYPLEQMQEMIETESGKN